MRVRFAALLALACLYVPLTGGQNLSALVQTAQPGATVEIASHRVGDASGEHIVSAVGSDDMLEIRHDAKNRRGFALGAVRAAEWLAQKSGVYDFREIFDQL